MTELEMSRESYSAQEKMSKGEGCQIVSYISKVRFRGFLTSIYECQNNQYQRWHPDKKDGGDRDVGSGIATKIFDDVKAMALNDVVYEEKLSHVAW